MLELKKVHEDDRGEIYAIPLGEDKELTILVTNRGYARGGCIHPDSNERCVVVKGRIQYFKGDTNTTLTDNSFLQPNSLFIPKGTPHFYISETDSILLEWGATVKEKDMKHLPFRNIVIDINKAVKNNLCPMIINSICKELKSVCLVKDTTMSFKDCNIYKKREINENK
jgi:mannose-6-phosphate isomerase-like protein (cupin superfamily)